MATANATGTEERPDPLPHQLPANRGKYSLLRALRHLAKPDRRPLDGLEQEVSREIERRSGATKLGMEGFYLPMDAEVRALDTTAAAGGIATIVRRPVIDVLRARSVVGRLGATFLTDLVGSGQSVIPRRTSTVSLQWFNDAVNAPDTQQAIGSQATISPCGVGALTDMSRRFKNVVPDAEAIAVEDLFSAIGVEVDRVALNGPGNSTSPNGPIPAGVFQDASIKIAYTIGANGGAPSHAMLCALEASIANANAEQGPLGFLTSPNGRSKMRQTEVVANTGRFLWRKDGILSTGQRAETTTNVPSNLTKGTGTNLTGGIMGFFPDLVVGTWGAIALLVNPYTVNSGATIRYTATLDVGTALKHGESFAACVDIATS